MLGVYGIMILVTLGIFMLIALFATIAFVSWRVGRSAGTTLTRRSQTGHW